MGKQKKINWTKCDKIYKEMFNGVCFNYCANRTCLFNKEVCIAYVKWDKTDGKI
jgi:hypothetical protein